MRIFVISITLILVLCGSACSDVIYFKNGGELEGIIQGETEEYIIIDVGGGTMTVRRDEIDHIREATLEELDRLQRERLGHEIEIGEWAPAGCEDIKIIYSKAKDDRESLRKARAKSQAIQADIIHEEKKRSDLLDMLGKKGEELKGLDAEKDIKRYKVKKNIKRYNEVIAEINILNADLNRENSKIKTLYEDQKEINAKLAKLVNAYRASYELFNNTLSTRRNGIKEDEMTSDELYFFEEMDVKIKEIEGDFKKDIAQYTPDGDHIIVDTLIDGRVTAQLMVDTGASIVLISSNIANRLGVEYEGITTEIDIIMADGSTAKAKPMILESVKVGDAEVKKVQAAILEKDVIGGVDGLLGMSFLSHFVIKVDSASNRLILERVL